MPYPSRQTELFNCQGLDLSNPPDRLEPGYYPKLYNINLSQYGQVEATPGTDKLNVAAIASNVHSLRRLNSLNPASINSSTVLVGADDKLYYNSPATSNVFAQIDSGYSGSPMSMVPFRPENSPDPWLYLGDSAKMRKVAPSSYVYNIGIKPPTSAPNAELSRPYYTVVTEAEGAGGWVQGGTAGAIGAVVRVPAATTISNILYDSGTTGWACITPTNAASDYSAFHPGARIILNASETVTIESVSNPITSTTISAIAYDSGTTGACCIVLAAATPGLTRNSIILLNSSEWVRVLSVSIGLDGLPSIRCSTTGTFTAGQTVDGRVSLRCYCVGTFAAGQGITGNCLSWTNTSGTGTQTLAGALDLSLVNGRSVQADDYLHISIQISDQTLLTEGRILLDVDATTIDFTRNYYYGTFRPNDLAPSAQSQLTTTSTDAAAYRRDAYSDSVDYSTTDIYDAGYGSQGGYSTVHQPIEQQTSLGSTQWSEIKIPIGALTRVGTDTTRTLANVGSVRVQLIVTGTVTARIDSWWVGGSYGPNVIPGSPDGIYYRYRYRASSTNARSNPGPTTRYPLFPYRQQVTVTCVASPDSQADLIDIERLDPLLQSGDSPQWTYIGTIRSTSPTFTDNLIASQIASNPPLETDRLQPFPVLQNTKTGVVDICGTTVRYVSGDQFPANLTPGTIITLNSTNYQTYSFPNGSFLELTEPAGTGTSVSYRIDSPIVVGQPLPILFGPLESAGVIFALGDLYNPGMVYFTNGNDPDSASDKNVIEVTPPSEPLIGGIVRGTYIYVASRKRLFLLRPGGPNGYIAYELPSNSGFWSPWAVCSGPDAIYWLGHDGLYRTSIETSENITDDKVYPLFPHQGAFTGTVTNGYYPVDMSLPEKTRLTMAEGDLYFDYTDTSSTLCTLRYDFSSKGWYPRQYGIPATLHYWEETPETSRPRLLVGTNAGFVLYTGDFTTDATVSSSQPVQMTIRTRSLDFGDIRNQKLYVDTLYDLNGSATVTIGFNLHTTTLTPITITSSGRGQVLQTVDELQTGSVLPLYRNISWEFTYTPGTHLYAVSPSYYDNPYVSNSILVRSDFGLAGYGFLRDGNIALASAAPVTLTVDIDGTQTTYTLSSTSSALRKIYLPFVHASKGKVIIFQLQSATAFTLFLDETSIRMKPWRGDRLVDVRPFQAA